MKQAIGKALHFVAVIRRGESVADRLAILAFPMLVVVVVLALGYVLGFRVNTTPSLPLGLYRLTGKPPLRGDTVVFCLEAESFIRLSQERGYLGRGDCPGGLLPLGKQIYALPGDKIGIEGGLISVNGAVLPGSMAKSHDSLGRVLPAPLLEAGTVPPGKALALALQRPGSFDGRYFGLVSLEGLQTVRPVCTIN